MRRYFEFFSSDFGSGVSVGAGVAGLLLVPAHNQGNALTIIGLLSMVIGGLGVRFLKRS